MERDIVMPKFALKNSYEIIVENNSTIIQRKAVYKIALYFKREMGCHFVQYDLKFKDDVSVILILDNSPIDVKKDKKIFQSIGAICFRKKLINNNKEWSLDWVWIHPYDRRKGILQSMWPMLQEKYGSFYVLTPLSLAMENFLNKNNHSLLI